MMPGIPVIVITVRMVVTRSANAAWRFGDKGSPVQSVVALEADTRPEVGECSALSNGLPPAFSLGGWRADFGPIRFP